MTREKNKIWVPKKDFRTRFAERDLEISINEYNRIREEYLESLRKKKQQEEERSKKEKELKIQEEQRKKENAKKAEEKLKASEPSKKIFQSTPKKEERQTQKKTNEKPIELPSIQKLTDSALNSSLAFLNRKIESKKVDAPQEKKEQYLDINIPSITSLVDDYTKPVLYNQDKGMFEVVNDTEETIQNTRNSLINKPTPLGNTQYEESYVRATDPVQRLKDVRERYNILPDPVDVRENREHKGVFWEGVMGGLISSPYLPGLGVAPYETMSLEKPRAPYGTENSRDKAYLDDIISTWSIGKNNAEFDAYVDAGIRLGEKKQYANIIKQYSDNINNYIQLQNQFEDIVGNPQVPEENKRQLLVQMNNILSQNEKLRTKVEEATTYKYDTTVSGNIFRNIRDFFFEVLDNWQSRYVKGGKPSKLLPDDIGSYGKQLLNLSDSYKLNPGRHIDESFLNSYLQLRNNIISTNDKFQEDADIEINKDKDLALRNKQEAIDWEEWHTPSKEFKAREKAAQSNYLTQFDTYKYGMWGVLGSSASFNGIQLLSTGLNWLGAGLLMAPNPYAKAAGAAATAAGAGLGIASGVYENRAEVTQNYIAGFRNSLSERGLLKEFLEKGRQQLEKKGITVRDDEDIFRHFILKDYTTNNPVIQDLALRHMFGANNVFQNDMMAVSADVAFNAGLNVFGATGKVAEALKILPQGSKYAVLRKVAENDLASSVYHASSKLFKPNVIASALSPLANIPYNVAVKPVVTLLQKNALTPMIKQAATYMGRAAEWAKIAPDSIFKASTAGKYVFDFLGKQLARGFSEAIEEGKQYEYGKMFSEGKFAGKSNSILSTLVDDLSTGLYTGMAFIGGQFFGIEPDKELMANMRGGFLGGILNSGAFITAGQNINNAVGELKAGDVFFNNVMAEKLRQRSNIVNGEEMAKYASRMGYASMMRAMDRIEQIHQHITESASDKVGLSKESIDNQRQLFRRISAIANSKEAKSRAKKLGIKEGSSDYRTMVSLMNVADQIQMENIDLYNSLVDQAEAILQQDGMSLSMQKVIEQARNTFDSEAFGEIIDAAEKFAEWAQPLNNQIVSRYNALNNLISELESRTEYLTAAERRNLNHYKAQREKLNQQVNEIKEQIGGTENMQILNDVPQDILDKYTSIYRTLYQASAQLETSTTVLNNLWGNNNARTYANEYVADELDFINSRINEINAKKDKLTKNSKKSARDAAALQFIEQYKKSVKDDIELMAEIADRFDNQVRHLEGAVEQNPEDDSFDENEDDSVIDDQETDAAEEQLLPVINEQDSAVSSGVQGLPADVTQIAPPESVKFPIDSTIENINEPGTTFKISDIKINSSTGQFLLEAKDPKGNITTIDETNINEYQLALPAPYHFENVFKEMRANSWVRFKKDSPFVKMFDAARNSRMPSIIDDSFRKYAQDLFKTRIPRGWNVDSSQYDRLENLMIVDAAYRNKMVEWSPIYGAIYKNDKGQYFYIPTYAKFTPELYPDFKSKRDNKLKDVKKLIDLRDSGNIEEIQNILNRYNINPEYINVLHDNTALMSIAEQMQDFDKPSVKSWLEKRARYMDLQYLLDSPEGKRIFPAGTVVVTNMQTDISNSSSYLDAVAIDEHGNTNVYIFAFSDQVWTDEDLDNKGKYQETTRREYYTSLANDLFATMEPHMQLSVKGMYVLPINPMDTGMPIKLEITTPINNNTSLQSHSTNYMRTIRDQIDAYISRQEQTSRTRPSVDGDGSPEFTLEEIVKSIEQFENVVQNIYAGTLSFNGKIRSDARQYLDIDKVVLNKYRNFLRSLDQNDNVKSYIKRIETLWQQITTILSTYKTTDVYNASDMIYDGETIESHRPIIPDNHALAAISTSGIPVTASSDFVTNGSVELMYGWYNPQTKEVTKMNQYSTHPGVGVYAIFTYDQVKYDPVLIQPAHYKDGIQAYTQKGAQFIMDVISLQNTSNGLPIIASVRRLIPNPRYHGPLRPVLEIQALGMTEDDIQNLTGDSDNVGIANANNNVQLINKSEDKSTLWRFRSTQSGSVFLFHSFNFAEYNDGGQIPVKLIPAKLDKSDIDVIVDILKKNAEAVATGIRSILKSRYEIDGKEAPITNEDVLRMLTTYDSQPSDKSMFYVDDFGRVFFRQRQSDPAPQPIDILTASGEQRFRSLIGSGYEIAQNRDVLNANLGNSLDPIFGSLRKWIKENGSLVISKNLVFDEDDVDRAGKGFSGIGWSIRHGRLLSNLSGIYQPSISISNPKINDGTVNEAPETNVGEDPTEPRQPRPRGPELSGLLGNHFDFGADFYATEELPEETLDEQEAREDIASILGDTAVEFVDDILCILQNGLKALGVTLSDVIVLSKLAADGVQFHESFHKIIELLIDDKTRQRIYKAFSRLHPEIDSNNPRQITEGLAEDFRAYAKNEKRSSKWTRFWRHIWRFVTTMFNADKRVLYKMYRDAYRGKYRNIKPSQENIDRFNRIFRIRNEEAGVLYHTIYDSSTGESINLPNVPSDVDYRDAINTVVDYIVSESGAGLFGSSVNKIKLDRASIQNLGKDGAIYKSLVGGENPDDINKIFRDIFDNWEHVLGDVALSLKRFGLHFKHVRNTNEIETYKTNLSEAEQQAKEDADESKAQSADINQYELADYEISKVQKMSERTKYFFATISDVRFVEEFDEEDMYVPERNVYGEEVDAYGRVIGINPETGERFIETPDGSVIKVPTKDGKLISTPQIPINMVRNTKLIYNKFGYPQFAPFHNTCKVALNRCYSANSLEELLQLFREASAEFPVFTLIAQRYAQLLNNINRRDKYGNYITTDGRKFRRMKNGLFQEVLGKDKYGEEWYTVDELQFKKNRNYQAMAVSVFNNISGTRLHFFNIMSTRPAPSSIVFQRMDTEGGYSARKYAQAWHSTFLNDYNKVRPVEVVRDGQTIVTYIATNKDLFKNVAKELRIIVDSYSNRRSQGWITGEIILGGKKVLINKDPEAVKAYYLKLLNTIGIVITAKEFNHLLFELFGKTDVHALRRYFQQDGEDFGSTKGTSISKMILAIEQGIRDNGEYSRTVVSGSLYTKVGAITQLADGIWSYRQTTRDLMTRAPGKNRYYQVANRNAQDIFMQDLNTPDSKMLKDFYSSPYHRASIFIDGLIAGKIFLRSNTSAGYVSDNKSDYGSDFMGITNPEDIVSKITLLLEGDITPPTLSNKKTYQPIQIIDATTNRQTQLPGIKYIANRENTQEKGATSEVYKANNVPILVDKPWIKRAKNDFTIGGKEFVVADEIYDILIKYAFSEYYQILENEKRLETIPESEKVVNYDTATRGAKIPGALRFSRFYEVYVKKQDGDKVEWVTVNFNDNNAKSYKDNLQRAEETFFGNAITRDMRKAMLTEIINRRLQENLEYLVSQGVIKHRPGWRKLPVYARYEPVVIDTVHLNAIQKEYGKKMSDLYGAGTMRSVATCAFVLDVMLKHQIAMEEYQRLFVGNPGLFVTLFNEDGTVKDDTQDLSKRLGGHMSTGETQCRLDEVPEKYTVAELKDYETTSSQIDYLKECFEESESRFVLYADVQKHMFIHVQTLRDQLSRIMYEVFGKNFNADGIIGTYGAVFNTIMSKDYIDEFARILEIASRSSTKDEINTTVIVLNNTVDKYKYEIISSEYSRQSKLSLPQVQEELEQRNLLTGVNARVAAYRGNFINKINVADGASFVSPEMVKYMLLQIGKFGAKVEEAWNLLMGKNVVDPLTKAEAYKKITDAMFGIQKYTATGYRMNNGQPITYYTKSAFFPLFPQIAHGRTKDILDKMQEDTVMMLCFESAKKFGSQGKQDFPKTAEELRGFHFNVYQEDFKYLRKQLNTDPKEESLQSMGSQTKKIALTILDIYKNDYVRRDGTIEDGRTLQQRIFDSEKALATAGFLDLMNRFSSVEEKSKYLRDNLGERDANSNMLQGLTLIQDAVTKQKKMRANLEALSNSGWIQSIITSLANKHIVDVNLPGSAYVQRSVYAMEDNTILGDNEVYGIPKLHISNDRSSMDAVVSIDYFYQFFPFLEDMAFDTARQWLIDHEIIGEKAKAETVAYRIPTQANSSIHALRFIDVISTVRDTIILPEEFTAITGSDFDIDKLFLSSKFFRYDEDTDTLSMSFSKLNEPLKYYGNELLECYLELLTQDKHKYANQLVRSIDYDTSIPMKVVNLLQKGKVNRATVYQALQLWKQCQIKAENRTGGIGVGPYALNNNNEIMTMQFEVESANIGIIKALDVSRLYDKLDAEGDSVMATIGAFITGHVDIAKDPWVGILNINEYTYDIHLFLARAGLGLRALWFCAQPIMKKCADVYIQAGGYLFDTKDESVWVRRRNAFNQLEDEYLLDSDGESKDTEALNLLRSIKDYRNNYEAFTASKSSKVQKMAHEIKNAVYIIQQIMGVLPEDPSIKIDKFLDQHGIEHDGTILQDIALNHNSEEDIHDAQERYTVKSKIINEDGTLSDKPITLSVKDVQFYVYLANIMIDDPVQDMKSLVQYSKVETKKQGKNRAEQLAYNHKYNEFFELGHTNVMLPNTVIRMAENSGIATKQNLFMDAMSSILGTELLAYAPAYEYFVEEFIKAGVLSYNKNTVKSVIDGLTSYQKWEYIDQYAALNDISIRDLFVGRNSVYNELMRIKQLVIQYPAIYRNYTDGNGDITNRLLEALQPADIPGYIIEDYGKDLPKFIDFGAIQENESSSDNDIIAGWSQMLHDTEHPDMQLFAKRLIVYAFLTSGDTNKPGSFFNMVPFSWREDESANNNSQTYIKYIESLLSNSQHPDDKGQFRITDRMDNIGVYKYILRNNWFDNNLVPTVQETSKDENGNTISNYFQYTSGGQPVLISLIKFSTDENGIRHFIEPTVESPKLMIKLHNYDAHSYNNPQDFKLYEFKRMGTIFSSEGQQINFPIYGRVSQIGGLMYGHYIIHYGDNLDLSWEQDTKWYTDDLDDIFIEGMAQLYENFEAEFRRNEDQIAKGVITSQELKEQVVRSMEDVAIDASYEDGTPLQLTKSNSTQYYNMVKAMASYVFLHKSRKDKPEHNKSLSKIKKSSPEKDASLYHLHSGGARGSDSLWGAMAKQYGVPDDVNHISHYYHGEISETNAPEGNVEISERDYEEGKVEAAKAAKYNWGYQYDTMKDDRLTRNWSQVKYADAIFAIGHIANPGDPAFPNQPNDTRTAIHPMVTGGTGYAVGMAILHKKPVYVFDQELGQWFAFNGSQFNPIDTPTLTLNFAGIGTRNINEAGRKAIEDVFKKTFAKIKKAPEKKKIDIWSTNHDKYANLSNVAMRSIKVTPSIAVVVDWHFPQSEKSSKLKSSSINTSLEIARSSKYADLKQKQDETGGIITTRLYYTNQHFGNPFSYKQYSGVKVVVPTVKDSAIAYEQWLRGTAYQDVEPERRAWILDQINSGKLDNKRLIYYTTRIPDGSYGRDTYDYYEAPNHAHILLKLINERKPKDTKSGIINKILRLAPEGFDKFNSVEQLFQLIKFEALKQYIREQAYGMYNLSGVDIAKGATDEAAAIKSLLNGIKDKQRRIFDSTGSKITSISHERLPDIGSMVQSFFENRWNEGGPENVLSSTAYDIMREIMLQSFLQNIGAAKLLLSTEDTELTHENGNDYWKVGFPAAIMSVRREISENYKQIMSFENTALSILGGDKIAYEEYSLALKAAKEGKMFSDVTPFFTEEEAAQIQSAIPEGQHLYVSSVFRNNDPAFFAVEIIEALRENAKKPFTDPTRINVIELWSKHDGVPIQNILEACKKYRVAPIVSFSITGLGNTVIEKGVLKYNDLLDDIQKLIDVGILDPRTTTFRVDPILPGISSVKDMQAIIERGAQMGIRKFVTSPMQTYSTQKNRDGSSRSVIPHIDELLKSDLNSKILYPDAILPDGGYDWMKYYGLHYDQKTNPGAINFKPKAEYIKPFADMFEAMMAKYDITIQCCALPVGKLKFSACLDPEIIEAVTRLKVDPIEDSTRFGCKCFFNHGDMFRTTRSCLSNCGYCYRGWNKGFIFDYYDENGKLKDMSYTKVNEYNQIEDNLDEPRQVVILQNKYTYNKGEVRDSNGQIVDDVTKQRVIWKLAVDLNKASLVHVNGIYYVVTNTGLIFNWGTAQVENITNPEIKKKILEAAEDIYKQNKVSTVFSASELKQLGESRKKFCKV